MIPDEAVEAAARVFARLTESEWPYEASLGQARLILEAAAPHLMAEVERELTDAKRMIALLVLESGGKVELSRRSITEISDETMIETTQDIVNGGWVIRARTPNDS